MGAIYQISIFLENRKGSLSEVTRVLADSGINLRALSIADTTDFGILRVIVDDVDGAKNALDEIGVVSKITDVIAVKIDDKTGGLASVLDTLSVAGVEIEYMYAFLGREEGRALMVIKTAADDAAEKVLLDAKIALLDQAEL